MFITAIILTYNEELHIARCVDNVKQVAREVYVIDSYSTDQTCQIALQHGAKVVQHAYVNQAQQFQWALDNIDCRGDWLLRLDADEYLTDALIEEIKETLPGLSPEVTGCNLPRDVIFLGKNVRHGRISPPRILRLWRKGYAYMEQRWMDERIVLTQGRVVNMKARFVDHNLQSLTWWTQKHNSYSNRELAVELGKAYGLSYEVKEQGRRNSQKSAYYRLPPFLRAGFYFLMRYVLLCGFLDGKAGLIWAILQAFWYRFLVDAKWYEAQQTLGKNPSSGDVEAYLRQQFGITFEQASTALDDSVR